MQNLHQQLKHSSNLSNLIQFQKPFNTILQSTVFVQTIL